MKQNKIIVSIGATFLAAILFTGCQTQLDPTGVYAAKFGPLGAWMYAQDNAVDSATQAIDAAEKWELQNHSYLATNSPQVVLTLARLRVQSAKAITAYYEERNNLASLIASTNAPELLTSVSNSIVTTVTVINSYSTTATATKTK